MSEEQRTSEEKGQPPVQMVGALQREIGNLWMQENLVMTLSVRPPARTTVHVSRFQMSH